MLYAITGYKYNTLAEAYNAINSCNSYYGIPNNPSSTTENWVWYNVSELDDPIFYYIKYLESLEPILGRPQLFRITVPDNV